MKILQILNYGYEVGGTEIFVEQSTAVLKNLGHEVTIITSDMNANRNKETAEKFSDREFHHLPKNGFLKPIYTAFNPSAYKIIKKILKDKQPDIVLLHTLYQSSSAPLFLLKRFPSILIVHGPELYIKPWISNYVSKIHIRYDSAGRERFSFHGKVHYLFFRLVCYPLYKFGMNNVNLFVSLSSYTHDTLEKQGVKSKYIPDGVEIFKWSKPKSSTNTLLYVGRLEEVKGVDDLLRSVAVVKQKFPHISLSIVGDGRHRRRLEELTEDLMLQKNVIFQGWKSRVFIESEYRQCDILIMPSTYPETFGLVGVEAMSVGRPVIATDVGGVRDWLVNGKNGYIVKPHKPNEIAEKILILLSDDVKRAKMGKFARKTAERFTIENFVTNFEPIMANCVTSANDF